MRVVKREHWGFLVLAALRQRRLPDHGLEAWLDDGEQS
jgi:hypothetical protein